MVDETDPRVTGEYVRRVGDALTIVGVVHDHPASLFRARRVVAERDPDLLALELPPIAVPLFEEYARSDREPPAFGGEMSAAIQAADADVVAGIDRPSLGFFETLARSVVRERPSSTTVRRLLVNTGSTIKHAVLCRLASTVASRTGFRVEVDFPVPHDVDATTPAEEQARDERRRVQQSRAFLNAVGTAETTHASRFEDAVREDHMADRLSELRDGRTVVAVVGIDHLDPLVETMLVADAESVDE